MKDFSSLTLGTVIAVLPYFLKNSVTILMSILPDLPPSESWLHKVVKSIRVKSVYVTCNKLFLSLFIKSRICGKQRHLSTILKICSLSNFSQFKAFSAATISFNNEC